MARAPGSIRDAIIGYLSEHDAASVAAITEAIEESLGKVSASSIRSYLNLNVPEKFERTGRGKYRLKKKLNDHKGRLAAPRSRTELIRTECFSWLAHREP